MPTKNTSPTSALHLVLERISSLFRAQLRDTANEHDLKLVQLEALVYLSVANRYSDTAAALGEYLGVTKGTISQTIRALEQRGLVQKAADANDGRVLHCRLTKDGARIAARAPGVEVDAVADRVHPLAVDARIGALRDDQAGALGLRHLLIGQRQHADLGAGGGDQPGRQRG